MTQTGKGSSARPAYKSKPACKFRLPTKMCRTSRLVYQANAWSVLLTSYSCCYIFMSVVYVIPDTRSCCYAFGTWPSTLRPHVPSINYNYLERDGLVLPSLLAQDSPLLASLSSHSGRRKAARPSSLAICSARCLQFSVRRANLANCFCNVFGGPFAKNSRSGPRSSKRSSSLVALDSITYKSSHQSSSSFGFDPPSCRPQSMMTPSRMLLPWHAVEVMARACDIGKPVLVTVYSRKTNGSAVRRSMKTKLHVSVGSNVLLWSCKSFV